MRWRALGVLLVWLLHLSGTIALADVTERAIQTLTTPSGLRFGIWGSKPEIPAPTLFIFASTIEGTLGDATYRRAGTALAEKGFLCVSIDLPCHGHDAREGEPPQLAGWRSRCDAGEDFVDATVKRLSAILDHLITEGYTDRTRVAACGTSRGGYIALQFTAHDPRVHCVAAYAPVTDLTVLREFHGAEQNSLVQSLNAVNQSEKLAGRHVWLIIGDHDERVGTDHAIALARQISASSNRLKIRSYVDLLVLAEPGGHTAPSGAVEMSVEWIWRQTGMASESAP